MYSGNRICFTCGKPACPGHARKQAPEAPKARKVQADKPRKIESRDAYEAYMHEIELQESECNRLLVEGKIGPLEHWTFRNKLEELRRRKDVSRRIAIAERAGQPTPRKLGIKDLKNREARA